MDNQKTVYPYIPNSVENIKNEMLNFVGADNIENLYSYIPSHLRFKGDLDVPGPILNEIELKNHIMNILNKNISTAEYKSFLGGGCARHYVPAICDEINSRGEFLTAYCGEMYSDHGKVQAIFEFTSLMSELVDMDIVGLATYDGGQAVSTSVRMTTRLTGKNKVLIPETMNPMIKEQLINYCDFVEFIVIKSDIKTGTLDIQDLKSKIGNDVASIIIENPTYLGVFEINLKEIGDIVHGSGGLLVAYVDPLSLGIVEAPANLGADITCGENQGMGMHMGYGSGLSGFIAAHDKPEYIMNFPNHFYALYENEKGEFGFQRSLNQRTSYGSREKAVEYLGTNTGLWAITTAVYLTLLGPKGIKEVGENIITKTAYAKKRFTEIEGIELIYPDGINFKEVAIKFKNIKSKKINEELLQKKIFGGIDLSLKFKELENALLFCFTEMISKEDIDYLIKSINEILEN